MRDGHFRLSENEGPPSSLTGVLTSHPYCNTAIRATTVTGFNFFVIMIVILRRGSLLAEGPMQPADRGDAADESIDPSARKGREPQDDRTLNYGRISTISGAFRPK